VKIKSGKIVPAMMTTTACVSALETVEIIKALLLYDKSTASKKLLNDHGFKIENVLQKTPLPQIKDYPFRNTFINIALNFMTRSDPAPPKFIKLSTGSTISVWEKPIVSLNVLSA